MQSCGEDIKDMLDADGTLGLTFKTNLFVGKEPMTPNNTVTIYDTYGSPPQLTFNREEKYFYDSVQIRVRNSDYRTGYSLANLIKISLHGRALETWNGTLYTVIYCSSGPAMLGWDDNGRVIFIVNFEIQRR